MTTQELLEEVNTKFGMNWEWPDTYEVDIETYVNVVTSIFENASKKVSAEPFTNGYIIYVVISENYRVMFKGMELRIKE